MSPVSESARQRSPFTRNALRLACFLACSLGSLAAHAQAATGAPDWEASEAWPASEGAAEEPTLPAENAAPVSLSLDARLAALDTYLEEIDAPTRRYFYSWLTIQTGLVAGQLLIALTTDDEPTRGSYFIGSGVAAASLGLLLIGKRPGMGAVKRFRALPSASESDKQAKLQMGEAALSGQAEADRKGTSWLRHLIGVGAALGSGAAVALLYEHSLKLATQRVFATFVISELQIMSRPRGAARNHQRYSGEHASLELGFAPLLERQAQGLALHGRF